VVPTSKAFICLVLVIVTSMAGCSGTTTGSMVDIGGRSLYLDCRGEGSPTVILEAGLTADTSWWDDVIDPIAGFTRVCAYDRANNGRSDDVGLHTGDQSVTDLEQLLAAKKIDPPYVLVAWSFGGPISRLFAARHPDDVSGMVLVDTDPTDYRSEGDPYVPENVREHSYWASENLEKLDLDGTLDLVREESTPGSFDDHPLVILTPSVPNSGNIGEGGSQGLPGPRVAELDELYLRLENEMTDLSSDSRIELVEDTGHCIQCDKPQVVIDAVREVVQT
jgi:pimeloyl-ACP methyl ester carboxylesterase